MTNDKPKKWVGLSDWQILAIEQAIAKLDKTIPGMTALQQLIRGAKEIKIR